MNNNQLQNTINTFWDENIIPPLIDYIKIPNKSPSFDSKWKSNGHMDRVLVLASEWAKTHLPENATLTVKETEGRTPLILVDIPGDRDGNILMYGHLDKQPEMEGWNEGLGPWTPVIKDEKLYGRGGADDGYALFASLCAVKALKEQGATLPRILILIEFCEESGSPDLPYYMNLCADVIGTPDLVVCLDSGAGDYKRFWTTTSLRGMIGGTLRVDVLTEGVHSGGASGHVPSSFRIARQLLSRLEDQNTGEILLDELKTQIPDYRIKETEKFVSILGNEVIDEFPWADTMRPSTENNVEGVLRRSWRPALSIVGADGLPPSNNAGNVLRPYTQLQLSMRIPPMVNPIEAQNAIEKVLIENPPYNASISVHFDEAASGWNAPETAEWLALAMNRASEEFYGESSCSLSEGGTIPFMAMLGDQFPRAQFVITGVLGPGSNAHGPNEFLHVPYAKKLTACVAFILNNFPK
ncbi:M20/M25/M40 family metallo-hydrolase [bacterium]|nr:M20/M25/M40 family metallo-hydrolase [Candidatus Neomarinimicrobiota bacterium]MDC0645975.1 M20/M25/M40 family metallo-hydrolase [bacterium]